MTKGVVYWNEGRPVLVVRGRWMVLPVMTAKDDVQAWCAWNRVQFCEGLPMVRQPGRLGPVGQAADSKLEVQPAPVARATSAGPAGVLAQLSGRGDCASSGGSGHTLRVQFLAGSPLPSCQVERIGV